MHRFLYPGKEGKAMSWARILMIDEDAAFRRLVSDYLARKGMELVSTSRIDIFAINEAKNVNAVLISRNLAESNRQMIQDHLSENRPPVIMISSLGDIPDESLSALADAELKKPMDLCVLYQILLSLLPCEKAILRPNKAVYKGLSVDLEDGTAIADGIPISLCTKEAELLHLLMSNPNRIFSREEISSHIWGRLLPNNSTITVHINHIRKKIGCYSKNIVSIRGAGYRFEAQT